MAVSLRVASLLLFPSTEPARAPNHQVLGLLWARSPPVCTLVDFADSSWRVQDGKKVKGEHVERTRWGYIDPHPPHVPYCSLVSTRSLHIVTVKSIAEPTGRPLLVHYGRVTRNSDACCTQGHSPALASLLEARI